MGAMKDDEGKVDYVGEIFDWLSPEFLMEVVEVMKWATTREHSPYPKNNWRRGVPAHKATAAAMRHLLKTRGLMPGHGKEFLDDESKRPHYAHAAANCMMAWWEETGRHVGSGDDDTGSN